MWYVLDASLIYGLQKITEEAVIREAIAQGTVERYLQKVPVKRMMCSLLRRERFMRLVRVH